MGNNSWSVREWIGFAFPQVTAFYSTVPKVCSVAVARRVAANKTQRLSCKCGNLAVVLPLLPEMIAYCYTLNLGISLVKATRFGWLLARQLYSGNVDCSLLPI